MKSSMATKKEHATRTAIEVHIDAADLGPPAHVGNLFPAVEKADLAPSFEYTQEWLASPARVAIDPQLDLQSGEQHSLEGLGFGVFADSAPDRWGRVLMERREVSAARRDGRPAVRMNDMFFMLGVNDFTRLGALRFRRQRAKAFLDDGPLPAPPATDLRELAAVAKKLDGPRPEQLPEYEKWLAMLVAPGTSLGGARPKATFTMDDGSLWLAKFPGHNDTYDWGSWEYLTYQLARDALIDMPDAERLQLGDRYFTYCVKRFDRERRSDGAAQGRRMYASAMTLTQRRDGQPGGSYLHLVEALEACGGTGLAVDLHQLFRRTVFNLLVGNRDDHLRNHGFLLTASGWRLSPAFDINPNPVKVHHALTWNGTSDAPDLKLLLDTAAFYRLGAAEAQAIAAHVKEAVSTWKARALQLDLSRVEIDIMQSAFAV